MSEPLVVTAIVTNPLDKKQQVGKKIGGQTNAGPLFHTIIKGFHPHTNRRENISFLHGNNK
jgi:hypothetical protein